MPATVVVNNLTVVHKSSGGIAAAFPDVCKTPSPAGLPLPLPYPNVARSSDTANGSSTVTMDGHPIMIKSSYFAKSTGDEAGTALGIMSSKIQGKAYPKMYSFDVKVDGEPVFRLSDLMCQNGGSPTNTPPTGEVQPPNMSAMPEGTDFRVPRVTAMRWSVPEAVCGDKVGFEVTIANLASSTSLPFTAVAKSSGADYATVFRGVESGSTTLDFTVRQQPHWERAPEMVLEQFSFDGVLRSEPLKLKTIPDAKELIGPFMRLTPQYEQSTDDPDLWEPNAKQYGWEVCYENTIKDGVFAVTRKVDFALKEGANPSAAAKAMWKAEIERVWNRRFKLHRVACQRGEHCSCEKDRRCCVFPIHVRCEWGPGHGSKVDLHAGQNDRNWGSPRWWYSDSWWEQIAEGSVAHTVRAHEFGHLIGMYDEYPEGACDPLRRFTDGNNVMGRGTTAEARHFDEFVAWFRAKTAAVLGSSKALAMQP